MIREALAASLLPACAADMTTPPPAPPPPRPPLPDRDVDVDDAGLALAVDDRCPGAPETRNGYADRDGCPDEIPGDLAAFTGRIDGVWFELDRPILRPTALPILDRAAQVLLRYPDVRVEVTTHLDSTASPEYSYVIGWDRSRAVIRHLVARGVDPDRLEPRNGACDFPLASNRTAAGRARNRRVEFTILVE